MFRNYCEDYLKEIHAKNYHGTDDNMPDDFESWISNLDVEEVIKYANDIIIELNSKLEKLLSVPF